MKVRLGQINSKVGDFEWNRKKIDAVLSMASSDELVIFPECALTGYPAFDLWLDDAFLTNAKEALQKIIEAHPKKHFVMGTIENGRVLRTNQAVFVSNGKILARYSKRLLPTYDVFDEARYFEKGSASSIVDWNGKKIFLSVCEDAWARSLDPRLQNRYEEDPLFGCETADLVVNLSASPYEHTKNRLQLFSDLAKKWKKPFAHVNMVGANDSLVFDGGSFAVGANGEILHASKKFIETSDAVDFSNSKTVSVNAVSSISEIYDALVLGIKDFCEKQNIKSVALGLSGGIDSALVACLASDALGAANLRVVLMPSRFTSAESNIDAIELGKVLQSPMHILGIEAIFPATLHTLQTSFDGLDIDVTEENIQSRIRGMLLMALSNKFGDLVLACGNKSEFATGYSTLYGDLCGGLAPIGDVYKTQVYELAREANRRWQRIPERIFTKAPSAELRANQKDQDTLPAYETLDQILELHLDQNLSAKEILAKGISVKDVEWTIKQLSRTEFKRFQAPPVLKVSAKAFGVGRRLPIVRA